MFASTDLADNYGMKYFICMFPCTRANVHEQQ